MTNHGVIRSLILLCLAAMCITGCANLNYRQPFQSGEKPDPEEFYLYGKFHLDRDAMNLYRIAIQIKNEESG